MALDCPIKELGLLKSDSSDKNLGMTFIVGYRGQGRQRFNFA
jgi:hypothetical protein